MDNTILDNTTCGPSFEKGAGALIEIRLE